MVVMQDYPKKQKDINTPSIEEEIIENDGTTDSRNLESVSGTL